MANKDRDLDYKLKDFPLIKYNMLQHSVFNTFLEKANEDQLKFCEAFFDNEVEILWNESPAGTGKTMCSVACAYADYLNKGKNMVFIIAPVSEDLGSRPGSQTEKELAYFMGLHDALEELNMEPNYVISEMLDIAGEEDKNGYCWVSQISHLFLRGGNLKNCTVIINEAQNFKHSELKKVLTRLHSNAKCVVEGNYKQIDLRDIRKSGFEDYLNYFKDYDGSSFHAFYENYRSKIANYADNYNWKK